MDDEVERRPSRGVELDGRGRACRRRRSRQVARQPSPRRVGGPSSRALDPGEASLLLLASARAMPRRRAVVGETRPRGPRSPSINIATTPFKLRSPDLQLGLDVLARAGLLRLQARPGTVRCRFRPLARWHPASARAGVQLLLLLRRRRARRRAEISADDDSRWRPAGGAGSRRLGRGARGGVSAVASHQAVMQRPGHFGPAPAGSVGIRTSRTAHRRCRTGSSRGQGGDPGSLATLCGPRGTRP